MSMKKPVQIWLALLLFGVGLAGLFMWLALPPPICRENAEKVRMGMTEPQVEAMFGGPAGDYTSGRPLVGDAREADVPHWSTGSLAEYQDHLVQPPGGGFIGGAGGNLAGAAVEKEWKGDWGWVMVWFDEAGKVTEMPEFTPVRPQQESVLDKLRRWWLRR